MTNKVLIFLVALILVACCHSSAMANQPAANTGTYTVKAGDCLYGIANKCGVTVSKLKSINGLKSNLIKVGQVLRISQTSSQNTISYSNTISRSGDTSDRTSNLIVSTAAQYLGTPYSWGGCSPSGFDCSGFVKYVMAQSGIKLPRTAASQFQYGAAVNRSELMPGDLVFFNINTQSGIDHVGIYVGDGRFIHSSSPRDGGVIYSSLNSSYYSSSYAGAKRITR